MNNQNRFKFIKFAAKHLNKQRTVLLPAIF